jgi:selenocysteine lyase/cysteine desulfurase
MSAKTPPHGIHPDTVSTTASTDAGLSACFAVPADTIYLDTAAHGPRLRTVQAAAEHALAAGVAPWRIGTDEWLQSIEDVRAASARFFDGDREGVALVPSAGYGLSLAARNLPLEEGDTVLVLDRQFPSNLLPWQQRCAETGARLQFVRRSPGQGWTDAVLATLADTRAVRVLALPQAHWHDGHLLDLDRIAPQARDGGAALVLDLSQSLGALPASIARWQPEFVVSVGHKWLLGAQGLAYLWAAPQWRTRGMPLEQGWMARDGATVFASPAVPPDYRQGARRFDAGGIADPQRLAMSTAALKQLHDWGMARVASGLQARIAALRETLDGHGLAEWTASGYAASDHAAHFLGLRPPAGQLDRIADALADAGVVCTHRQGILRIAPHLHVSVDEMRYVGDLVAKVAGG